MKWDVLSFGQNNIHWDKQTIKQLLNLEDLDLQLLTPADRYRRRQQERYIHNKRSNARGKPLHTYNIEPGYKGPTQLNNSSYFKRD